MQKTSSSGKYMTREGHEDAHFFAFVTDDTKAYVHDKGKSRKAPARQRKELLRCRNPPLSFTENRQGTWWVLGLPWERGIP